MAYTINKTDGTVVTTIVDGTVDNTTSLQLFGKSYSGFGEGLNENLLKLLENSASTSSPTAPLKALFSAVVPLRNCTWVAINLS